MNQTDKSILYRKKRYTVFALITAISLILPFLTIGGKHFLLLSFDKKQFHLLFNVFSMQELIPLTFLFVLLFIGIFFISTLAGRVWCAWCCPQTIFRTIYRDLLQTKIFGIYKSIENKQVGALKGKWIQRILAFLIWAVLAVVAASDMLWYFVPPEDFFSALQNPAEHKFIFVFLFIFTALIISVAAILKEKFCVYVCPYVRFQSVMFDDDTIQTIYNYKRGGEIYGANGQKESAKNGECTHCEACVKICPTHIDIRKGMQLECINCLECADACTKVMNKFSKPTLISWTSPNAVKNSAKVKFARFRTVGYGVVLTLAFIGLIFVSTKKEHMILDINRNTQLFTISQDKQSIRNSYKFLFENTDTKDHTYYFEVLNSDIEIDRPSEPFEVRVGGKTPQIVILKTAVGSSLKKHSGKPTAITIRAYAIDDKENIFVEKNSIFFYPADADIK